MEIFEDVDVEDLFGTVRSRHRVDNKRRMVTGYWALAIGAVATVLGVVAVSITSPSDGVVLNRNAGGMLGLIVHSTTRRVRGWGWDEVTAVTLAVRASENGLSRTLGTGFRCVLAFGDGTRVKIDGLAQDPNAVVRAVREHRPDVPVTGGLQGLRRLGPWWLACGAAFLVAGIWMLVTIFNSSTVKDVTDANGNVTETQISTVSDTGYLFLGLGILVCLIGLAVSVSMFTAHLATKRRLS